MEPKFFNVMMTTTAYTSLWAKYRPAIIQLMVAAEDGPQKYRLFDHEFKALNPKAKTFSFELGVYKGKATNSIKTSQPAQDLLSMLSMSRKATELLDLSHYEFSLDKHFNFHVTRMPAVTTTL